MKNLIVVSAVSNVCGIIATALIYTSFFTQAWLRVYRVPDDGTSDVIDSAVEIVSVQRVESDHGLWDHGLEDLNCVATPYGICMYTRAAIFAGMVLAVPGILFNILSTSIIASGGRLETSGTIARAGGIVMILTDIGTFIGVLLFTLQHTTCITSCPPLQNFYPTYPNDLNFGWSFILAWIGLAFFIATTVLMFVLSCLVEKRFKVSFSPNRNSLGRPNTNKAASERINIELVRVNPNAAKEGDSNTIGREDRHV